MHVNDEARQSIMLPLFRPLSLVLRFSHSRPKNLGVAFDKKEARNDRSESYLVYVLKVVGMLRCVFCTSRTPITTARRVGVARKKRSTEANKRCGGRIPLTKLTGQ